MTPAEITSRYPVGYAIELSQKTRELVRLFALIRESDGFTGQEVEKRLLLMTEEQRGDRATLDNALDEIYHQHPLRGAFSDAINEHTRWIIIGTPTNVSIVQKLAHAVIFADLIEHHGMTRRIYNNLLLHISEESGTVVVRGHTFTPMELGLGKPAERCPDTAPPMDDEDER